MKILLWATTLQADILGLAFHLDANPHHELLVVTEHAASFLRSPIARHRPLAARVLDRDSPETRELVGAFGARLVVCDNHFPPFAAAPRVCSMWHGLGWKARPARDLAEFFKQVERLTGIDPRKPNPRFLAQCYHERDRDWRVSQWGLNAAQCAVIGSCFGDLLRGPPPYDKSSLESEYPLDLSRKTVLVNLTWHFGRLFPGTWQPGWFGRSSFEADLVFLRELFASIHDAGANILFCLHDRKRYEPRYLAALHELSLEFGGRVALRHKDEHPDNWADLCIADVMISNLSSFATFFYYTGRPTIHLCPPAGVNEIRHAHSSVSGLRARSSSTATWMNDPRDNGGFSVESIEQALAALDQALRENDCCRAKAARWLSDHVSAPPESAAARFEAELEQLSEAS